MKKMLLLVLILLVSACTDSGSSSSTKWRTGTDGIVMNFVDNSPPSQVIGAQQVHVIVEYYNRGAHELTDARFYLTGYDPNILGFSQTGSPRLPLPGKSIYNPQGSYMDAISWTATVNSPQRVDSFVQDLTVTACYKYQTIASPEICVDPQKFDYTAATKCGFTVRNLGSSQGGPVAVTDVKQKSTNNRILLEITIENKGRGTPFTGQTDRCHTALQYSNINTVYVQSVSLGGNRNFHCLPGNQVRLNNGRGFVVCETPMPGGTYFVSPLVITLDYGYRQSMSRSLTVVNVN
jgi:hypothetical protein